MKDILSQIGRGMRWSETANAYAARHGIDAAPYLTVVDDEIAAAVAHILEPRTRDKVVVDVGGGTGLLALHVAASARRVFVVEANPVWAACWIDLFHKRKPKNVSYLFGAASEFIDYIKADVAIVATHSDVRAMMSTARQFAPEAIDIYGELISENPKGFDEWARRARENTC
jgi:precorrin-6B methylase 2